MNTVRGVFALITACTIIFSTVHCQSAPFDLGREKNVLRSAPLRVFPNLMKLV